MKVTALSIGSGLLGPEKLETVAALPTRDEALAKLLATFKAPVGKFVQTINEVPSKFARVLTAIKEKKEAEEQQFLICFVIKILTPGV